MAVFSLAQQRALAVLPKISGSVSLIGSVLIVVTVLRDKQKRRKSYHRLLCGISCVDISSSFWLGMSTWPIPRESGVLWASGTTQTCSLQGFFTQFGIASIIYNASLSTYYLLVIKHGWKEDRIKRIEPFMHVIPSLWGLGTSIAGLPLTLFNNANLWCWIAPLPFECQDGSVDCIRGDNADVYRWVFFYGPLWCMIGVVTLNVILIFRHVRRVEQASEAYRFTSRIDADSPPAARASQRCEHEEEGSPVTIRRTRSSLTKLKRTSSTFASTSRTRSQRVANQCFWYAGAFYLNWIALTMTRLIQTINENVYFPMLLIAVITTPLQGLPNFLVYLSPKFLKLRRENPNAGVRCWLKGSLSPSSQEDSSATPET